MIRAALAVVPALLLAACASTGADGLHRAAVPEATPYASISEPADAERALEQAKQAAAGEGKLVLAVFGADWCHDSRALAGLLGTPRFTSLTEQHYVVTFIDVGAPQQGEGRNLDLLARYGVTDVVGTPNLLVIDPADDAAVNADTAKSWRNAASRSEDAVYEELALLATTEIATD